MVDHTSRVPTELEEQPAEDEADAVTRETRRAGVERFHIEDADHPVERRLGHGCFPVKAPAPIVTLTLAWSNAT
jgi:hypothetical protein